MRATSVARHPMPGPAVERGPKIDRTGRRRDGPPVGIASTRGRKFAGETTIPAAATRASMARQARQSEHAGAPTARGTGAGTPRAPARARRAPTAPGYRQRRRRGHARGEQGDHGAQRRQAPPPATAQARAEPTSAGEGRARRHPRQARAAPGANHGRRGPRRVQPARSTPRHRPRTASRNRTKRNERSAGPLHRGAGAGHPTQRASANSVHVSHHPGAAAHNDEEPPRRAAPLDEGPAATYSPRPLQAKYHRRYGA